MPSLPFPSRCVSLLATIVAGTVFSAHAANSDDPLALADPRVGTAVYGGAMYPGAALPGSMVKLSPQTTKPSTAGYNPTEPILGFGHAHIGGTGGDAFAGQLRVRPQSGPLVFPAKPAAKADEIASPGYYSVSLPAENVRAELTVVPRAGLHRYTFSPDAPARILFDVASTTNNRTPEKPAGRCVAASARFVSPTVVEGSTRTIAGNSRFDSTVYFVAVFDQTPTARGTWIDSTIQPDVLEFSAENPATAGFYAEFAPGATVGLRVGFSYTSPEHARRNLEAAAGLTFDQIRERAADTWRDHFANITVEGGTEAQRRQFYTALYHTVLTPTDVTGDNANWTADDKQRVFWDVYTLWDTFRTAGPLLTLIEPQRQRDIINHLLAIYQKDGWLPDAWTYNKIGIPFQGGTHADNVIADAVVKNLGGFDVNLAYEAIRKNATVPNPANSKIFPLRGRLAPYLEIGYVPAVIYTGKDAEGRGNDYSAGVSRTLEYAYNDFAISQVAAALGRDDDAKTFRERSLAVYQLFHPEKQFFWGKNEAGEWMPDHDLGDRHMGWNSAFYEGTAWQYRFSMPHDVQGLINRLGGEEAFLAAMDAYFEGGHHWQGNEPGFLNPWLHVYAGRPDKTADRVHAILAKDFNLGPSGYPGDEDVGTMSAYYIFASMGFFPNAAQDIYLIGSPIFTRSVLQLGDSGKSLVISAPKASPENKYVQSLTLNGKSWNQAWFRHADIADGAELVFEMGPKPSAWGTKVRPPSLTPAP